MTLVGGARAATSGTATVTLSAAAMAMVDILDPATTITPIATDYDNNYVEVTGASGQRVRVRSNSSTGMVLYVRCSDATPQIALADLLLKTQTAAGTGGTTMGSYTAASAVNTLLWSTTTVQPAWQTVTTDVRVNNLITYSDAAAAGTTSYTNTLTYSVVVQ
jgi:hypothetical protein